MNYYNEYDRKAAAWLRELIKAGLIPAGDVDERSIVDVQPQDLDGYTQCHFFAGIGGWSLALQLAGVGPDEPIWTGSCPCQPFSSAGKGKGTDDERHLWPEFARLIGECKPPVVFGEQVASKAGREWFDGVSADLEDMDYAAAAADLCAAGVGAPHIRQRLWWVADRDSSRLREPGRSIPNESQQPSPKCNSQDTAVLGRVPVLRGLLVHDTWEACVRVQLPAHRRMGRGGVPIHEPARWLRIGPDAGPVAYGVSSYVGRMRGYGNAIVPQVAAEFIRAYQEI